MSGADDAEHRETVPPDWGHRRWQAEDLLRAAIAEAGSDADPAPDGGVESRIHRFLNRMDDHVVTFRSGDDDQTYSFSGQSQGDAQTSWPQTPPIQIPNHDLLACIGLGGFGQVWLARHHLTDHFRACKLIPAECSAELHGLRQLKQRVPSHPSLFPIEEVGTTGDWLYVLMPLADCDESPESSRADGAPEYRTLTLHARLRRGDPVTPDEAARIGLELLDGLDHLHTHGVVHGDIKPGNCLRLGGRWTLADYGMLRDPDTPSGSGHTPGYVPPEGPGTRDADLYAFGVLLTRVLKAGAPPARRSSAHAQLMRLARRLTDPVPRVRRRGHEEARGVFVRVINRHATNRRKLVAAGFLAATSAATAAIIATRPAPSTTPMGAPADAQRINKIWERARQLDHDITASRESIPEPAVFAADTPARSAGMALRERDDFIFDPKIVMTGGWIYAITEDGRVIHWGRDYEEMPGIPKDITDPVHIATNGPSVMVLQANGTLVTWGYEGREPERAIPEGLPPVVDIELLFQGAAIAVLADGTVRGWGKNWSCAGPGTGLLDGHRALTNIVSVNGENGHWVYTADTGLVGGRGCGWSGQLNFPNLEAPPRQVIAAESWTCLLDAEGRIHVFGYRGDQWLRPPEGTGFIQIAAHGYSGLALHEYGRVVHWGDNRLGQGQIPDDLVDVIGVAAGSNFSVAFHADGTLTMWGDNQHGQLDWPRDLRIRLGDPDLNGNGIPDWIDKLPGRATDQNQDRSPLSGEAT